MGEENEGLVEVEGSSAIGVGRSIWLIEEEGGWIEIDRDTGFEVGEVGSLTKGRSVGEEGWVMGRLVIDLLLGIRGVEGLVRAGTVLDEVTEALLLLALPPGRMRDSESSDSGRLGRRSSSISSRAPPLAVAPSSPRVDLAEVPPPFLGPPPPRSSLRSSFLSLTVSATEVRTGEKA